MEILRVLFTVPLLCAIVSSLIKFRFSYRKSLFIMILYTILLCIYDYVTEITLQLDGLAYLLPIMVSAFMVFFYLSKYRDMRFVFSFLTELAFASVCIVVGGIIGKAIFPHSNIAPTITILALLLLTLLVTLRWIRIPMLAVMEENAKGFAVLSLIPTIFTISCFVFMITSTYTSHAGNKIALSYGSIIETSQIPFISLYALFLVVVYVALLFYFHTQQDFLINQKEHQILELQAQSLLNQCQIYDTAQERMREFRHDFRHNIAIITALLENKQYEQIKKHIENLGDNIQKTKIQPFTSNLIINSVVSLYDQKAKDNAIIFTCTIQAPQKLPVNDIDIAMLLANGLDNAFHACQTLAPANRKIDMIFRILQNKMILEIRNPCQGKILFDEQHIPINKENGHGIGCHSMVSFANKYNCDIEFKVENDIFILRCYGDTFE